MTWKLRDRVTWTPTEYGGVLLDSRDGQYWTLNVTGAEILATLLAGGSFQLAVSRVNEKFDADPVSIAADVPALIADLEAAGLVVGS
jgi:Coenzyme PQQ synthesis protein D (PqqD)